MADTTVKQLAQLIDRSVETLVSQMQEAGLSGRGPDDLVTDAEKQQLLAHLKRSHGGASETQQQITLKRKTVSTIKTTPVTGGKAKTVSVEVRKTRTFVKPSDEAAAQEAARKAAEEEAARQAAEEKARLAAEEAARAAEEAARMASAEGDSAGAAAHDDNRKSTEAAREKKLAVMKPAAAAPRKAETPEEKARREAEEARRKAADEARKAQEAAARKAAEEKARQRTLEQAAKIAADLAARPDSGSSSEDVPLARGLVGRAFEDSFAKEDREIRRGGNNTRGGKNKGGKKREEEQNYRPAQRALSSALSKQHGFEKPVEKQVYKVKIGETILVADLAQQMAVKAKEVTRVLMKMGEVVTQN
ncbi:MAG TPA: translation initiation factor IF-2 associated domain-containing protein, partial [Fluviicoccus sp.]|nr:translation initiation factor IF-2 associated domain-containing protein [Fluviicoccus sp.]